MRRSLVEVTKLAAFLASAKRPKDTLSFHELQGFLFAIASSPELIPPSEWILLIGNDQDLGFGDDSQAQEILSYIMALYNQVNTTVLERREAMPDGCAAGFSLDMEIVLNERLVPGQPRKFAFVEKDVDSVDGYEPGFAEFLEDATLSGDVSAEEVEFLRNLRVKGKRPSALYYLRGQLHFQPA